MADFKYIMQGFQKDINFFDEIKEVLETEDYTSIWILTAFVNERAICNLMPSIKKSKADISFIIGIRNNVSTYQALKCLINMKVSVFVFDTARIESIFHAKVIVGSGTNSAKVICGSANITTGGLANNIEAGIINILETDYHRAREERNIKFKELFVLKQRIVIIYQEIYAPIEQEIKKLLGDLEETIEFQAEMQLMDNDFSNKILSSISQRFAGVFKGKTEANNRITRLLRSTEFSDENSVLDLVNSIILAVDEDIDNSEKKITDKKEFYDYLYGLEYVGVSFKLKMGGRDLEELSPGERGIVLLIFYLALSQNSIPIIIDQPEDNLDNQSVYNKLVPCICAAKQKRQVIIVTHNPNIAVACDAEQIICCKMDKNTHKITYLSGAIEDQEIKQNVVDILEGTMPAFDLRRRKYV